MMDGMNPRKRPGRPESTDKASPVYVWLAGSLRERMDKVRYRGESLSSFGAAAIEAEIVARESANKDA